MAFLDAEFKLAGIPPCGSVHAGVVELLDHLDFLALPRAICTAWMKAGSLVIAGAGASLLARQARQGTLIEATVLSCTIEP